MNNKKAIEILQNQKLKLDNPNILKDETWVSQTASYIKDFFGENSTEYSFISNFNFKIPFNQYDSKTFPLRIMTEKTLKCKKYLENCIETINDKGLYKKPKRNFLNTISDTALWTTISIGIPGLLTIGGLFGNMFSDNQNVELRTENKMLKDSISIFRKHSQDITAKQTNIINTKKDNIHHNLNIKRESDLNGAETKPKIEY